MNGCWYSACKDCGLYCYRCGRGYPKPLSTATFTVALWDHDRHIADLKATEEDPHGGSDGRAPEVEAADTRLHLRGQCATDGA